MGDISKPYTKYNPDSKKKYEEGWERIFGKKKEKTGSGSSVG